MRIQHILISRHRRQANRTHNLSTVLRLSMRVTLLILPRHFLQPSMPPLSVSLNFLQRLGSLLIAGIFGLKGPLRTNSRLSA